jgi:hypothetical protein
MQKRGQKIQHYFGSDTFQPLLTAPLHYKEVRLLVCAVWFEDGIAMKGRHI